MRVRLASSTSTWWALRDSLSLRQARLHHVDSSRSFSSSFDDETGSASGKIREMRDNTCRPISHRLSQHHRRAFSSTFGKSPRSRLHGSTGGASSSSSSVGHGTLQNPGQVEPRRDKRIKRSFNNGWQDRMKPRPAVREGEKFLSQAQPRGNLHFEGSNVSASMDPWDRTWSEHTMPPFIWMRQIESNKRSFLPFSDDYKIGQYVKFTAEDWESLLLQVIWKVSPAFCCCIFFRFDWVWGRVDQCFLFLATPP
jgi:hypothetical protein